MDAIAALPGSPTICRRATCRRARVMPARAWRSIPSARRFPPGMRQACASCAPCSRNGARARAGCGSPASACRRRPRPWSTRRWRMRSNMTICTASCRSTPAWSSCRRCSRSPRRWMPAAPMRPPRSSPAPRSCAGWRARPAATAAMPAFAAGIRRRSSRASARRPPPAACSGSMPPASPAPWACPMPRRAATSSASRTAAW